MGSNGKEGYSPNHAQANGPQSDSKLELFGFDSLVTILGLKSMTGELFAPPSSPRDGGDIAITHGRPKVVLSGLHATSRQDKLSLNAFISKLLASSTAMPLHLHCDPAEPNSAWNWLERWSLFHKRAHSITQKKFVNGRL